jgi:SAM-dependent methyltransferase/uncharacterized protein YbaR (Trm112 family)
VHPDALALLTCPQCSNSALLLRHSQISEGRIDRGTLSCWLCRAEYPIHRAIPRFVGFASRSSLEEQPLSASGDKIQAATARNFGEAWQLYAESCPNPYTEAQFLDWIHPLTSQDFSGQTVLDLGCGLGGFMDYAAQYHPKQLLGLEISVAIDSAADLLLNKYPHITLVQGDILHPPFRREVFDLVYSIGVLHHLQVPQQGFEATLPLIKPEGRFFFWVYGRENNALVVYLLDPLRKLTSRLPVSWVRHLLALPLALLLFVVMNTLYLPGFMFGIFKFLPYEAYFNWLRPQGWRYAWGMVTDQLIPPQTHYLRKSTLLQWLDKAWMVHSLTARNGISWRVLAQRPSKSPSSS